MRQVVLCVETTGGEPWEGHRVVEIGAVEIVARRRMGARYHVYINPERAIDDGAFEVHGLTESFLAGKPTFAEIADGFLAFVAQAELVIHNAPFDIFSINYELSLLSDRSRQRIDVRTVTDTLVIAQQKHPWQDNSIWQLCHRYGIDALKIQFDSLPWGLVRAESLAQVYLALMGREG